MSIINDMIEPQKLQNKAWNEKFRRDCLLKSIFSHIPDFKTELAIDPPWGWDLIKKLLYKVEDMITLPWRCYRCYKMHENGECE